MQITHENMVKLFTIAKRNGTMDQWCILALEWMAKANDYILELKKEKRCKGCGALLDILESLK